MALFINHDAGALARPGREEPDRRRGAHGSLRPEDHEAYLREVRLRGAAGLRGEEHLPALLLGEARPLALCDQVEDPSAPLGLGGRRDPFTRAPGTWASSPRRHEHGRRTDRGVPRSRARVVRAHTVRMAHDAKSPHVGSALSAADILVALYFHVLNISPPAPTGPEQDRFVLSKGHGLHVLLRDSRRARMFPAAQLETYSRNGGSSPSTPAPSETPDRDRTRLSRTRPLGLTGASLARKLDGRGGRAFVLMSDGECNEGTVWETAMFASGRKLDNLVAIVDDKAHVMGGSKGGGCGALSQSAFGWRTGEIDGDDMKAVVEVLEAVPFRRAAPLLLPLSARAFLHAG